METIKEKSEDRLPLLSQTPDTWAQFVLKEPLKLLNDHAYLERKAATNALDLLNRWPDGTSPQRWIKRLAGVARDETQHLDSVTRLLLQRGGTLERTHRSPYASELRKLVRDGSGPVELADRLMISALLEARSCERFDLLARFSTEKTLSEFYRGLWSSEFGHYRVFLELAQEVIPASQLNTRWRVLRQKEAALVARLPLAPQMLSGTHAS